MSNLQWVKEVADFKSRLRNNVTKALEAYMSANEADSGQEYWNDEYGFDAKLAFEDFIKYLFEWDNEEVNIDGLVN